MSSAVSAILDMVKYAKNVLILIVFACSSLLAESRPRMAILDFEPKANVSGPVAAVATAYVREILVTSQHFTVIERNEIDVVLEEQAFQQSGCTDTTCAVEIGRLLAAQKIMIGEVTRVGDRYIISARIIDVERGEVQFAANATVESLNDLEKGSQKLGRTIIARLTGKADPIFNQPEYTKAGLRHLIPGWGHMHREEYRKGSLLMGGWFLTGMFFLSERSQYQSALDQYEDLAVPAVLASTGNGVALNYIYFGERQAALDKEAMEANIAAAIFAVYWFAASGFSFQAEDEFFAEQNRKNASGWHLFLSSSSHNSVVPTIHSARARTGKISSRREWKLGVMASF